MKFSIPKSLIYSIAIVLISSITFVACNEDEDDPDPVCDQCSANEPWSKPGITDCYASQDDCEANEGGTCQTCN